MGQICASQDTNSENIKADFADREIVGKEISDKMGKTNVSTPEWMKYNVSIPKHCADLKAEKITIPFKGSDNKWVYIIPDVLSATECESLIKLSEQNGYMDALVNIGFGQQQKIASVRNCKRVMIDNHEMAHNLWKRLESFIPTIFNNRKKISFNERLRFLRYHKGEYFAPHFDGTYVRDNQEELSQITVVLYLNDGYKGATTNFLDINNKDNKYAPKISQGMALLFEHHIFHEGAELLKGVKYILRTDVMYSYDEIDENNDELPSNQPLNQPRTNLMEMMMTREMMRDNADNDDEEDDENNEKQ